MGFWDARLSDLEAQGVQFSDEEVEIMERGGRLVHLHPFEDAEEEGGYNATEHDRNGEAVLTIEVIRAVSPLDRYNPGWKPEVTTVCTYLDGTYSRRNWTQFPAYPAVVDMEVPKGAFRIWEHPYLEWRAEEIQPYAWFNCIPYDPSMDAALIVLAKAQNDRHMESLWDSYHWISDMWRNYMDPLDAWLYQYRPEVLTEHNRMEVEETVSAEWGGGNDDVTHQIRNIAEEMDEFYRLGIVPFPEGLDVNGTHLQHPYPDAVPGGLPWKPLEHYIPANEVEALNLYHRLLARRRLGLAATRTPYIRGILKEDIE